MLTPSPPHLFFSFFSVNVTKKTVEIEMLDRHVIIVNYDDTTIVTVFFLIRILLATIKNIPHNAPKHSFVHLKQNY